MTGGEFATLLGNRRQELQSQLAQNQQALTKAEEERAAMQRRTRAALDELLTMVLPDLSDATLQGAAALTGYTPLLARAQSLLDQQAALQQRQAQVEAEPAYRDRQLLRAPRIGTLSRAIDELAEFRAPLAEVIARCAHPRLDRLMESGYGTPRYSTPFWRLSYYSDWEAGDAILARFPGKTFADVREEFLSACNTVKVYDERLRQLRAEVAAGEALETTRDSLVAQREALPGVLLQQARDDLGAYLMDSDPAALGERFAQAPQHLGLLKRVLGLKQQDHYLEQASKGPIAAETTALQQEIAKADKAIEKFQRPKNAYAAVPAPLVEQTDQRLQTRMQKAATRREEYLETREAVSRFDRYEDARLTSDFLWWDLMTGGRVHGGYIPEVAAYRQRYPHQHYYGGDSSGMGDDDWMNAAAASAQGARARRAAEARRAQGLSDQSAPLAEERSGYLGVDIS